MRGTYRGPLGNNWIDRSWPYLVEEVKDSDEILVFVQGQTRVWFEKDEGDYKALYGDDSHYKLVHSTTDPLFVLTIQGNRGADTFEFHDFEQTGEPEGLFKSHTDAYGTKISAEGYFGSAVLELRCMHFGTLWSLIYDYVGAHVSTATLRRSGDDGANWSNVRRAVYEYYGAEDTNGSSLDLKQVTRQLYIEEWKDTAKSCYRWYKPEDAVNHGFLGALKYVVGPQAFAEMLADDLDPLSVEDDVLAQYADHYFEYDENRMVSKEIAQNCASCGGSGGTGEIGVGFTRTESGNANGMNAWKTKVVLTKANGNIETVYTNYLGFVMLKELRESDTSGRTWVTYYQFGTTEGSAGKVTMTADPDAVASYDEEEPDLGVTLFTEQGLIAHRSYGEANSADGETLGDALGFLKKIEIQNGSDGDKIPQQVLLYKSSPDASNRVYLVGKETRYRENDGGGEICTDYLYEWYANQSVKQRTTVLPAIPQPQHGNGVSATTRVFYDSQGKPTFSQSERGIVTKNSYDEITGNLSKIQVDVASDEPDLPTGWTVGGTTPHQNLTTNIEYDSFDRQIQTLGPAHQVVLSGNTPNDVRGATWMVYQESVTGDQTWTAQGFQDLFDDSFTLVDPVSITMFDKAGRNTDQIQSKRSTGTGKLNGTDTFLRADWTRWSVNFYNLQGNLTTSRSYHTIPPQSPDEGLAGVNDNPGSEHTNYQETHLGYDPETNLQVRQVSADGTITRTVYDGINRPIETWVGTNDVPTDGTWHEWSPDNTDGTNLVKLSEMTYDDGNSGGPSLITSVETWVDGSTTRLTQYQYDFRRRRTVTIAPESQCTQQVYNNLNQVIETTQHDGVIGSPPVPGTLIGKQERFTDDRGRVYETKNYAVNPTTGTVGNALVGKNWFDAAGLTSKSIAPGAGEVYSRHEFDNLGRTIVSLLAYADTSAPDDEVVISRSETTYNDASSLLFTVNQQRDTGSSLASPTFRSSYTANWYDGIDRPIAAADYGTNGGALFSRPATVPARSDDVLVTSTAYNDAGEAFSSIDPAGKESRTLFDAMGRTTQQIDNYQAGGSGTDVNVTTEFTYTADSQIKTLTAKMSSPATDQVTTYIYGVTPSLGSELSVNNLLFATQYPEDSASKREEYAHNRQGQRISKADQNGTVHRYDFDGLGRQTQDRVTTVGSGVDAAVRRIAISYEIRGLTESITSFDDPLVDSGTALNQVELAYNDFRQLTTEYLALSGMVNTSSSPKIQYSFANGSSNQVRQLTVTYPSGRAIDFDYGSSDSVDERLSRVQKLIDGATTLVEYNYLGASMPVQVRYPQPDVTMDLWGGTAEIYTGLDRFGRLTDLPWIQDLSGTPTDLARIKYGYNRASSPTYARDEVARAANADLDQLYGYDGLQRLIDFQQGELSGTNTSISSSTLAQDWNLDQVGNWDGFNQEVTGILNQTRTHNRVNEITGISNSSGQPVWVDPGYDDAGNMTLSPRPNDPTNGFVLTFDPWNRITKVETTDTSPKLVAQYAYDGRNHRTSKRLYDSSGSLASTIEYFYNSAWQCVEEQETPVSSNTSMSTYVWGIRYIDDLVCRDTATDRLYAMQDRQYKMVGIVNPSGNVVERYSYTPYGETFFYAADFTPRISSNYAWVYLYTSRRLDPETGLYYFRNRYYSPGLGRFCSRDPIKYQGGSRNLYEYVGSNSIQRVDPSGLKNLTRPRPTRPPQTIPTTPGGVPTIYPGGPAIVPGTGTPGIPPRPLVLPIYPQGPDLILPKRGPNDPPVFLPMPPGFPKPGLNLVPSPTDPEYRPFVQKCWRKYNEKQCCNLAQALGLDKGLIGAVVCCYGRKYACDFGAGGVSGATNKEASRIINECTYEHETIHLKHHSDDFECPKFGPPVLVPQRRGVSTPEGKNLDECLAYRVERECLEAKMSQCGSDQACWEQVRVELEEVLIRISAYCP